jgi:tetratricopeptide (TPR) repeat protein
MDNKEFDRIMHDITSGLTGDPKNDVPYLMEQCEVYKDHEMGKEIVRACGRLVYEIIPDDKKNELNKVIKNDNTGTESILEEVRFNIYKQNYEKALSLIEPLVCQLDEESPYQDDQVSEYHTFFETFEEVLYGFRYKPEKDLRNAPVPLAEIYLLYGSLLVDLKRIEEAQEAFKKALHWNPVSFMITSEYVETYKVLGDYDTFFKLTIDAFKIAFHPQDVARCFRNLGFYFVEKELYAEAIATYLMSLQYEKDSKQAQSELYYINSKTEGNIKQPSMDDLTHYSEKYGFPMGADQDILGLSFSYGQHFYKEKAMEAAKYFLGITYGLTEDPEIKKLLDNISEA